MISASVVKNFTCRITWHYTQFKFALMWLIALSAILMLIYTKQLKLINTLATKCYITRSQYLNILDGVQRTVFSTSDIIYQVNVRNILHYGHFSKSKFTSVEDAWPPEKNGNVAHYIQPEVNTSLLEPSFKVQLTLLFTNYSGKELSDKNI